MRRQTLVLAVAAALLGWARRGGVRHVTVSGGSMRPTFEPGDRLLLVAVPGPVHPRTLVLAPDPRDPARTLLKRAHAVDADGVELRGDHAAASTDSRTFGRVGTGQVRGYVAWRYATGGTGAPPPA